MVRYAYNRVKTKREIGLYGNEMACIHVRRPRLTRSDRNFRYKFVR